MVTLLALEDIFSVNILILTGEKGGKMKKGNPRKCL